MNASDRAEQKTRCASPLTGSWSKERNGHYAHYHCQRQCRAVNVKAKLEGAFADERALLEPRPATDGSSDSLRTGSRATEVDSIEPP